MKFIHEHKAAPFFLFFPHTAVHVPLHPGEKPQGKSANGRFGDWVEELDWSVGRMFETLREPTIAWWPGHVPAGSVCDAIYYFAGRPLTISCEVEAKSPNGVTVAQGENLYRTIRTLRLECLVRSRIKTCSFPDRIPPPHCDFKEE